MKGGGVMNDNVKQIFANPKENKVNLVIFTLGVIFAIYILIYLAYLIIYGYHSSLQHALNPNEAFYFYFLDPIARHVHKWNIYLGVFYASFIMFISIKIIQIRMRRSASRMPTVVAE